MKRIFVCLLVLALLLSALTVPTVATETDFELEQEGLTFGREKKYEMRKLFEKLPIVTEAWIYFPADFQGYGGVIMGNYGIIGPRFHLEILAGGKPQLHYSNMLPNSESDVNTKYTKNTFNYVFDNVNVYTGEWLHLAVVVEDTENELRCYINGELVQTLAGVTLPDQDVLSVAFAVGGDHRTRNNSYFRGALRSLAVYSDYRDERKIKNDLKNVDVRDENLILYYDLTDCKDGIFSDHTGGKYDLYEIDWWLEPSEVEPVKNYAYSLCLVGDTQIEAHYDTEKFTYIYDWIVENAKSQKIAYVIGLGDIVDKNPPEEWALVNQHVHKMDGVVPYSLVRGNHDWIPLYNEAFCTDQYLSTCGGIFEEGHIENSWRTFRAEKTDFLLLTLEYGPRNDVLEWAAEVIEQHPKHKVIITTHAYLTRDGTTLHPTSYHSPTLENRENNGSDIWDKLGSQYENVYMILSGHIDEERVVVNQRKGKHGNLVTEMLINPQGISLREAGTDEGAIGLITMLYFNEDGSMAEMRTYSTVRDLYFRDDNQGTISFVEVLESSPEQSPEPDESISERSEQPDQNSENQEERKESILPWIILAVTATVVVAGGIVLLAIKLAKSKKQE